MASMSGYDSGPHWWEASALTTAPPHPNLRLIKALRELRRATNVMCDVNVFDYTQFVKDPIHKHGHTVDLLLTRSEGNLPNISFLPFTTPRTSRFYVLPKIHKTNNTGRPIVSACSCPMENISAFLDEVMTPLVRGLPTYVKDTNHDFHIFDSLRFDTTDPGQRFLITMDVKSLYTVIPNDCGLQALTCSSKT
ncbi:unnamed protein product, partial [Porites lobata]